MRQPHRDVRRRAARRALRLLRDVDNRAAVDELRGALFDRCPVIDVAQLVGQPGAERVERGCFAHRCLLQPFFGHIEAKAGELGDGTGEVAA